MVYGKIETFPLRISDKKHGGNAKMILCDTSVIIEALKKNPIAIQAIEKIGLERIAVSVVTVMELYYGALNKAELKKINVICRPFEYFKSKRKFPLWHQISLNDTQKATGCRFRMP